MRNWKAITRRTENKLLSIQVYKLISQFLFRFKHRSRKFSVLIGKNIEHGPLKEKVIHCKLRIKHSDLFKISI